MTSRSLSLATFAAGAATTGLLLGGCAMDGGNARPSSYAAAPLAAKADKASAKAVVRAERAVLAAPRDAAIRAALGAAYLRAGRFASAVEAYDAALQLGDESVPTVLGLALGETARGNNAAALELLNDWKDAIPPSDLGLAYALAGDTGRGVAILAEAVRGGDASAKSRQNLALAFALDGRWREARLMVAQDVPADQVDARIGEWAQLARPEAAQARVAQLLAVPVVADPGQPAQLALVNFPDSAQLAAQAAVETQPQPAAAPVETAVAAKVEPPVLAAATPAPAAQPITLAAFDPPAAKVASDSPAFTTAPPMLVQPAVKPRIVGAYVAHGGPVLQPGKAAALSARKPAPKPTPQVVVNGSHVVQLGSYTDPAVAKDGWGKFVARTPGLKPYRPTTTTAVVNGTNVWRVAAAGFASYGDAVHMCRTVRSRGGACLVVSAKPSNSALASR